MLKCFQDSSAKGLAKTKKILYVTTTEESERETKDRMCGVATLSTMEMNALVTARTLNITYKRRLHCGGSNASDTLGPLQRQKKTTLWTVTHSTKPKLYAGSLMDVGGKVEGDAGDDADPAPRSTDAVPFTWHSKPSDYYEEMMHAYNITSWWDLTASDDVLPLLAVKKNPILGRLPLEGASRRAGGGVHRAHLQGDAKPE